MKSAAGARDYRASRLRRAGLTFTFLAVALCVVMVLSAGLGQYYIPTDQVIASVGRRLGLAPENPAMQLADSTLWNIRFPRVLLGVLVGAALGTSGAVMQSVFGNPLAEPGVIGVSSGAAVGACLSIVLNLQFFGIFTTPAFAFVGALAATALVYFLSRSSGRAKVLSMILTGIAVTAVANAIIAFLMFIADTTSRDQIVFWQMGSLNGSTWKAVASVWPVILVACFVMASSLDVLALGERAAQHSGVNVERLRAVSIAATALLTGAAVAYAGIIAFIGLIIPHLLRMILGPSNRVLLPASALGGALLIALSDLGARTLVPFADLPIGIFTALVGGPTFFVLLRRSLGQGGGAS